MPDSSGSVGNGSGFPKNVNIGHEHLDNVTGFTYQFQGGGDSQQVLNWKIVDGVTGTDPSTVGWGAKQLGSKWYNSVSRSFKFWNGQNVTGFGPVAGNTLSQQTPIGGTVYSVQHGLGAIPSFVVVYYECVTAELGYSIGDRTMQGAFSSSNAAGDGFMVEFDATTLRILVASNAPVVVLNRTTPALYTLGTAANWKMVAIPYLLS